MHEKFLQLSLEEQQILYKEQSQFYMKSTILHSVLNLESLLLWRASQFNIMFRIDSHVGHDGYLVSRLRYITPKRRVQLV